MKVLVFCIVSCSVVVLSYGGKYDGPKHVPVIDENGVPVETPEVRQAREQHLKALLRAEKLSGGNLDDDAYEEEQETRYVAPKYLPEPPKKGVFLENYELKTQPKAIPVVEDHWNDNRYNGEDRWNEPNQWNENQNGNRLNEGVSYNQNTLRYGDGDNQDGQRYGIVSSRSFNKYEGPTHVPILTKDGVPEETPEVKAAREEHLRALEKARQTIGTSDNEDPENPEETEDNGVEYRQSNIPRQVVTVAKPVITLEKPTVTEVRPILSTSEYAKENPGLIPKIGKNGVPLDTPEVYQAKLRHFAALARAAQLATGQYNPKNQIDEEDGAYQEVRYKPNVGYDLENRYRENEEYRPQPYRINRPNIIDPYRIERPNIVDPYRINRPIVEQYRPNPEPYKPNVYKVNSYKSYVPIPQDIYRPDSYYKPTIPPYRVDYRPKGYPVLVKVHNPPSPYPIAYNNIENSNRLVRYVVVHDQKPRRY